MDQDIRFQKKIAFDASSAMTTFMIVPYRCTMRNITGIVDADPGDAETVTVTYGTTVSAATAIGVLTFGSSIAAGAVGTWAANASTGNTVMAADGYLKFVTTTADAANCDLSIELDPYARTTA